MGVDIAVIDYGMGNLRSVSKAFEHVAPAASVVVTSAPDVILGAGRVVFPGGGAMPPWRFSYNIPRRAVSSSSHSSSVPMVMRSAFSSLR